MTVWDHLVANSTLAEADGDAWEHLINPSGEGGGGITIINSVTSLTEEPSIMLSELPNTTSLIGEVSERITEIDTTQSIREIPEGELNGIC